MIVDDKDFHEPPILNESTVWISAANTVGVGMVRPGLPPRQWSERPMPFRTIEANP
jgi:hypothetical protein